MCNIYQKKYVESNESDTMIVIEYAFHLLLSVDHQLLCK